MKIFVNIILAILVFLAVSSGLTKITLMEQDVEFFSEYGFTNSILVVYGAAQLIGGILLILPKTRLAGAIVVAITFLISAIVLILAQSWLFALVTCVSLIMLALVANDCLRSAAQEKMIVNESS